MNNIILVASGKGGVGKTTITANLAACLEKQGKKILIIDADIYLRNMDLVLGVQDNCIFDVQDLLKNQCSQAQALVSVPGHPELSLIASPSKLDSNIDELYKYIYNLAKNKSYIYDYVFIDCPAGIEFFLKNLCHKEVLLLCIATPDITSIRDAEKTAMIAHTYGIETSRLIINRVNAKLIKKRLSPDIDEIIDGVSVQLIGLIPDDTQITVCTNKGIIISDNCRLKVSKAFRNIALRITGKNVPLYKFW